MIFDSNAYQKLFLGTKAASANSNQTTGFITTAGIDVSKLQDNTGVASTTYGIGSYGFFNASTWKSVTTASIASTAPLLILASASLQSADKIGGNPFNGGYLESNKSKTINPKLITRFLRIDPCTARQHTLHIGSTKYTKTLSPSQSACNFEFLCGSNYNLRIELRGAPTFRFMNRNIVELLNYDAPCCAEGEPGEAIDGTLAMIEWANRIIASATLKDFITPIVYSEAGVAHYPPGTTGGVYTWDNYVSPGHVDGQYAGLRLTGAYVDTTFGNCSFDQNDYVGKAPVEILASMVDFNGEPCTFTGICVNTECLPFQANGLGETVLRDLIQHELYRQNKVATGDVRIREIEMGDDVIDSVTRSSSYYRYVVSHTIPRTNNPGQSYSEEKYDLVIITNGVVASFETFMAAWLANAGNNVATLVTTSCGTCTPLSA
jgi:hypothetical protein